MNLSFVWLGCGYYRVTVVYTEYTVWSARLVVALETVPETKARPRKKNAKRVETLMPPIPRDRGAA